jgi:hypothetical protein
MRPLGASAPGKAAAKMAKKVKPAEENVKLAARCRRPLHMA